MHAKHGQSKEDRLNALQEAINRSKSKKVKFPTVAVPATGKTYSLSDSKGY
jgi:hypothetical protein|tara:strand:+ start:533 stop:685 length:153 start_codon:yes stop_codon:yes gene_type:complete